MSFLLWRIRTAYKIRVWWRKLPGRIRCLFKGHRWVKEAYWNGSWELCRSCHITRNFKPWSAKEKKPE